MFTYSRTYILFLLLGLSSIPARPQSAFTYKTLVETGEVAPAPRAMGQILESSIDDHGLVVNRTLRRADERRRRRRDRRHCWPP